MSVAGVQRGTRLVDNARRTLGPAGRPEGYGRH
jgi:hypothetical protein